MFLESQENMQTWRSESIAEEITLKTRNTLLLEEHQNCTSLISTTFFMISRTKN